jgi:hypothetical protein
VLDDAVLGQEEPAVRLYERREVGRDAVAGVPAPELAPVDELVAKVV